MFLEISQNSQENDFFLSKKETLAQVFFCEFCEIFMNTFFTEHFRATASEVFKSVKNERSKMFTEKSSKKRQILSD